MRNKKMKSQKGAISVFVMMAMLFFLFTILGVYSISSKRAQTQTESFGILENKYYKPGEENERYSAKIMPETQTIPIYTKEQFWTIGTGNKVEIEEKIYTFSNTANYQLQNDIIINIQTDLAKARLINHSIDKNQYEIYYYYEENYYTLLNYSGTKYAEGNAVLRASGENFSDIVKGSSLAGAGSQYYLFASANPPVYGTSILSNYADLYSSFDSKNPIKRIDGSWEVYSYGNYKNAWSFWQTQVLNHSRQIESHDSGTNSSNEYNFALITAGNYNNTFTTPVQNNWVSIWLRANGMTSSAYWSNFKLNFSNGNSVTVQQAVNSGYIEPLVLYSSGSPQSDSYTWKNIGNFINGGQTDTASYAQALIMLRVTDKVALTGISFYTNKSWNATYDGLAVHLMSDMELSTEPF